jgi:nucleotidyltransferase/DNA polymerase involved in DNA repair
VGLVLFVDMDYFYAACEEVRHPDLKDKPFVVGTATIAKKERGVVQTCNYAARKFGIHSAMATMQAFKLKHDLIYLESDEKYYEETSDKVMKLLKSYGFKTEAISIDEAALDLGEKDYTDAETIAKEMKERIRKELGLPCTIGVSVSKTYAKMACDSAKPNGLKILKEEELMAFLSEKKTDALLGVGKKTSQKLEAMGIKTVPQLAKADPNVLVENFGAFGKELFLAANGKDRSRVEENYNILSIGRERTLEKETKNIEDIDKMIRMLSEEVMAEISKNGLWFKGISVKARYADLTEKIKNRKLNNYTDSFDTLYTISLQLIKELIKEKNVRKVGVRTYLLEQKKGQRSMRL